jgi:hypothetical protein
VTVALEVDGPAPFEAELIETLNNVIGCTRHFPWWIDVINA